MSNFVYGLFFVQFFIYIIIFFMKTYNIMRGGWFYPQDHKEGMVWLLFIGAILMWGIGMFTYLEVVDTTEYALFSALFLFQSFLLVLHVPFLIAELFYYYGPKHVMTKYQSYYPGKEKTWSKPIR